MKFRLFFAVLFVQVLSMTAYAYDAMIDGIYYNFNGEEAEVTYQGEQTYAGGGTNYYSDYSGVITIPTSVTYHDKTYVVTSIGEYAFLDCSGLTSITIPEGVMIIGACAFAKCTGLTSITIPNSVVGIEDRAFLRCTGLTSINIPNSVTSIGSHSFQGCILLTSITIPEGVTDIGGDAFSGCTGLKNITIPESVTSIGGSAFEDCSGLTSITIPGSVTSIGVNAFNNTAWYGNQSDGVVYAGLVAYKYKGTLQSNSKIVLKKDTKGIAESAFADCIGLTSITIPEGVTSIGNRAFEYCIGLTTITIPESVTSIGYSAFYKCSGLTSITISEGVASIGGWAFYKCIGLTSVTIPNSVASIGNGAFSECSGLTSITIPEGVTSIGEKAFEYCYSLNTVKVSVTDYAAFCNNIVLGYISSSIGKPVQLIDSEGKEIKEFIVPDGVTSIGNSAFRNCKGLTTVTIPNCMSSIGDFAFSACIGLTSVTIPNSVNNIGENAFQGCNKITDFYCYASAVPNTSVNAFTNQYIQNATLHVPAESVEDYSYTDPWYNFGSIVALTEEDTAIGTIKGNQNEQNEINLYDLSGRKLYKLQRGINIVHGKDGSAKKVMVR